MIAKKPVCLECKNYHFNDLEKFTCKAFPNGIGIPDIILTGGNKHTKPLPKQGNDIIFEKEEN